MITSGCYTAMMQSTARLPARCRRLHTVDKTEPVDYCLWFEWAKKKSKTHRQERCPECGLYKIWVRRKRH